MADTSLVFDILARDKTQAGLSAARKRAAVAFAAIGAAAIGYGVKAVKAAADDQQASSVLAQTLKNTTGARQADIDSVEDWIGQLTLATGVADDQLRPALSNLARGSGDLSTAQDQLKVAMDVAAATGKPLVAVTEAMMKAQTGNVGALGRLGLATKDASGKTKSFADIYADMSDQFGGAQAAKTASAAGQMQVMQNAMDEATESVGYGLLPILTTLTQILANNLLPPLKAVTDWMSQNANATKILVGVLAVAVGGMLAVSAATKIMATVSAVWKGITVATTAVQWLLNAALTANPIGIVVVAIAALIGALVLLYQKNETVRRIIDAVWSGIKTAIGAVVGWFQNTAWPIIKTVAGYIGGYYKTLFGIIRGVWNGIKSAIGAVVGWFQETAWPKVKAVADLMGGVWSTISGAAKSAFNAIASVWNNTVGRLSFSVPDWVPGIGGRGFDVPDIPMLAAGGIVTRPTLALVGEAGPEAVVPLSRGRGVGGTTVINNFYAPQDPIAVGRATEKALAQAKRANGGRLAFQ